MWIKAATDPFGNRGELISRLYGMVGGTVDGHARLCAAAWLLDESELAVRLLRESLSRLRAPGVRGNCGATVSALQWACIDTGRWDEPLLACREATDLAAAYKMEAVAASASLATATVLAMRGVHDQVRPLVTSVLATIDAAEYRGFAARAWRAAGIAALAEGRYLTGYAQLSQLRTAKPAIRRRRRAAAPPCFVSGHRRPRCRRGACGAVPGARRVVERALARVDSAPGPRLDQLAARAPRSARRARGRRVSRRQGPVRPGWRRLAVEGLSCSSTTGSGSGGSTTPNPSSRRPWRRSAASVPRPGPGARRRNCAPAA